MPWRPEMEKDFNFGDVRSTTAKTLDFMFKQFTIFFIVLFVGQSLFGQYQKLNKLIPPDFTILDSVSGDINKDGIKDLIIILRNKFENFNTDTTRPLLVFQGNSMGQYKLIARNDRVVLCLGCGGVHGDPYEQVVIKNGYFSVEHFGGSGWRWTRIITFRYDSKTKQFILHRDAGHSWHFSDPNKTTENLFNKEDFGKLYLDKYSYEKNW